MYELYLLDLSLALRIEDGTIQYCSSPHHSSPYLLTMDPCKHIGTENIK